MIISLNDITSRFSILNPENLQMFVKWISLSQSQNYPQKSEQMCAPNGIQLDAGQFAYVTLKSGTGKHVFSAYLFADSATSFRQTNYLRIVKNKVLSEREFLKKMFGVLKDFRKGDTKQKFPEKIAGDLDAQAFYGVTMPVLSEKYNMDSEVIATVSQKITQIVRTHDTVDWKTNIDIHNRIRQDIDDLFYEIENNRGVAVEFDDIDKISESVLNVAIRRF